MIQCITPDRRQPKHRFGQISEVRASLYLSIWNNITGRHRDVRVSALTCLGETNSMYPMAEPAEDLGNGELISKFRGRQSSVALWNLVLIRPISSSSYALYIIMTQAALHPSRSLHVIL